MMPMQVAQPASAREWRARVRGARRRRHGRRLPDVLSDLYIMLWVVLVYGWISVSELRRHLGFGATPFADAPDLFWIVCAGLLALAGLAWMTLSAVGPLVASPAEQSWGLSTPVDRGAWLRPRLAWLVLGSALAGALTGAGIHVVLFGDLAAGAPALLGAGSGVTASALAVAGQAGRRTAAWTRAVAPALLAGAGILGSAVVGLRYARLPVPVPPAVPTSALALGAGLAAAAALWLAHRALPRLPSAALGAGAQLTSAALAATVCLDPALLHGILETRRCRRIGTVVSRPFHPEPRARPWMLVQADVRRALRKRTDLWIWVATLLAQHLAALLKGIDSGAVRIVLAYVVASRFSGGLRTVMRSAGLRRALGGSELTLRVSHLVFPSLAVALWWLGSAPASGGREALTDLACIVGVLGASYRSATSRPLVYGGAVVDTPLGLLPVDLIMQLARGLDLLAVLLVAWSLRG